MTFRSAAFLCAGLAAGSNAAATTFSTDLSDLWYAAPAESESGWGVNVAQQDNTLFLTMFVYGANGQPTWFVGSNTAYTGTTGGTMVFSGPLFATGGTAYSAPWNPGAMTHRQVGSVTFSLTSPTTATLSYTADGAQVTKSLVRQTWKWNDLGGQYIGAVAGTFSRCANSAINGFTLEHANIAITHDGQAFSMDLENSDQAGSCAYNGTYSQAGRLGALSGNYSCTGGNAGTFTASEIEGGVTGFTMKVEERSSFCNWSGRIGGVRATP